MLSIVHSADHGLDWGRPLALKRWRFLRMGENSVEVEGAAWHSFEDRDFRKQWVDIILGGTLERRTALRTIRTGEWGAAIEAARAYEPDECDQVLLAQDLREELAPPDNQLAAIVSFENAKKLAVRDVLSIILARDSAPPRLRGQAAKTLGKALCNAEKDRRTKQWRADAGALIAGLDDPSPEVRYHSAFGLGVARVSKALPKLRQLAKFDRSRIRLGSVAKEAREAIECIEGGKWPKGDERSTRRSRSP